MEQHRIAQSQTSTATTTTLCKLCPHFTMQFWVLLVTQLVMVTLLLHSLQWDRDHILASVLLVKG